MPIDAKWQKLDSSRANCSYCLSPLELGDTGFTCERCWRWLHSIPRNGIEPTADELQEWDEYEQFLKTRPRTPLELEIEETARLINTSRRCPHED